MQLGTVRFLGTFLPELTEVPKLVVDYVASQLDIADPSVLKGYGEGETRWDHAAEIRRVYGYRDFGDEPGHTADAVARGSGVDDGRAPGRAPRPRRRLRDRESGDPRPSWEDAPEGILGRSWKRIVHHDPVRVDHRAYTLCAVERLREALRRRDVFVPASRRWGDPRAQLLSGKEWEAARDEVCRSLRRSPDPAVELAALAERLDAAYRRTAARLPDNPDVAIAPVAGRDRLKLSPLDRLDEPASLVELRRAVRDLLPKVDLPEVLLEVAGWTGFVDSQARIVEIELVADPERLRRLAPVVLRG